jgi:hypothetical protein
VGKGDSDIVNRAITAAIGRETAEQHNRESVLQFAAADLKALPPSSDANAHIDPDWLNMFSSFASQKSTAEIQSLWGRVLAGEIRQPGAVKLRTLQELAVLEVADAHLIHEAFAFGINGACLFAGPAHEFLSFGKCLDLAGLGVVQFAGDLIALRSAGATKFFLSPSRMILIEGSEGDTVELRGIMPLSQFGRDLYSLTNPDAPPAELIEKIAAQLRNGVRKIGICELGPQHANGSRTILGHTPL